MKAIDIPVDRDERRNVNLAHEVFDRVGQLNSLLAENLAAFDNPDVYVRAAAREHAALLYRQLAAAVDNDLVQKTFALAADACAADAAALRFAHGIPTLFPVREHQRIGFRRCESCGRPWSPGATTTPDDLCAHCPRLRQGPTPNDAEQARSLPAGVQVEFDTWPSPAEAPE